jgi:ABC-type polysaccharide transport system permease subunit
MVIRNTVRLSLYTAIAEFPVPIILALALNSVRSEGYKKTVQTVSYMPHFISMPVIVGLIYQLFQWRLGIFNILLRRLGLTEFDFLGSPGAFSHLYVWTGIWQNMGWGTIIFLASLSAVDPGLYEASTLDGATRMQKIRFIEIPAILPTIIVLFILRCGSIVGVGFEKVFLMQNPMNIDASEVIATYVYKVGLASLLPGYAYSTAIGLVNSFVNFLLLIFVNSIARRMSETSLW